MSPHAANSLVHDLVQMAQAMEQLPQVREELRDTKDQLNSALNTVQRLEAKLMDRANEINELNQKVRSAEASRDDAETMFLEADERTSRALDFIKATFGNAGSLIQALEPRPQEPVSVSESPIHSVPADTPAQNVMHTEVTASMVSEPIQEPVSVQEDPIAEIGTESQSAFSHGATENEGVSTQPSPGPYHDLNYFNYPIYVSLEDWLAGGGTSDDYWNRREPKAAE